MVTGGPLGLLQDPKGGRWLMMDDDLTVMIGDGFCLLVMGDDSW